MLHGSCLKPWQLVFGFFIYDFLLKFDIFHRYLSLVVSRVLIWWISDLFWMHLSQSLFYKIQPSFFFKVAVRVDLTVKVWVVTSFKKRFHNAVISHAQGWWLRLSPLAKVEFNRYERINDGISLFIPSNSLIRWFHGWTLLIKMQKNLFFMIFCFYLILDPI